MTARLPRRYSSPARADGARRTRACIIEAAATLFVEHGYAATSLQDIATAAGVARPTVTSAFSSKCAILAQVLDQALAGDDEPVPVRDRPWFVPVWQASCAEECLRAYAEVVALIGQRASRIVEVIHRASDGAPDVAELWQRSMSNRRLGAAMVIEREVVTTRLRPGLTQEDAIDVLWTLNDSGLYTALVTRRGWTVERYARWLADTMCRLLLEGDSAAREGDSAEPEGAAVRRPADFGARTPGAVIG